MMNGEAIYARIGPVDAMSEADHSYSKERFEEAKLTLESAEREYEADRLDESITYYESAEREFHSLADKKNEGLALLGLSRAYEAKEQYSKAVSAASKASSILEECGDIALAKDARIRYQELRAKH